MRKGLAARAQGRLARFPHDQVAAGGSRGAAIMSKSHGNHREPAELSDHELAAISGGEDGVWNGRGSDLVPWCGQNRLRDHPQYWSICPDGGGTTFDALGYLDF
jgi:bacteriocin-like protein